MHFIYYHFVPFQQFFKPGIENIKSNNGDSAVTEEHIQGVCRQILEEVSIYWFCAEASVNPCDVSAGKIIYYGDCS